MSRLTGVITASDLETRNQSLDALCHGATLEELIEECQALDGFRRSSDNLYQRVRALFFLYAIHRFHIPLRPRADISAPIPFAGYTDLLKRRFEEAPAEVLKPPRLVTGDDLIAAGYVPGPSFGPMLAAMEDAQLEGALQTKEAGLSLLRARFEPPDGRERQAGL